MNVFKNTIGVLVVASAMALASCGTSTEETTVQPVEVSSDKDNVVYEIDPESSQIEWTGNMLGMYSHSGVLKVLSGNIIVNGETIVGGQVVVDMKSITPTDNGYSEDKTKEMLVEHLSSADFFDVSNYPVASIKLLGADKGELTIRGKTETVSIGNFDQYPGEGVLNVKGKFDFNRKDFGVSFDHPVKENVLSDQIDLVFILNAKKVGI